MYLVLLGAPGAGKGTQAAMLVDKLGLVHVSSGDLFRDNLSRQTELGQLAKSFMDKGELVPDGVTIRMVMERLAQPDCARGVILDGFPRTLPQAQALDQALDERQQCISWALYIYVQEESLIERLSGRWTCRQCRAVYHQVFNPPQVPGVCDSCGGEVYQRPDDMPETQKNRIQVYLKQTQPLIDYYKARGLLVQVDGHGDVETVNQLLLTAIQGIG